MEIRTYRDAQVYLEDLIRPFASIASPVDGTEITPLERMRVFLEKLGNPHKTFRSVVVTGTAGKGSTAYLLSHVLTAGGYRTGLTISPHLQKLTERLQVNGKQISEKAFVALVQGVQSVVSEMEKSMYGAPSYHEILAGLALLYFSRQKVDLAVVEVGIEAKYEASNLLSALGVFITNISLDHMDLLGGTVDEISDEVFSAITREGEIGFVVSSVKTAKSF